MKDLEIIFNNIKIGDFRPQCCDFPSRHGSFIRCDILDSWLSKKLDAYIEFWIEAERVALDDNYGEKWNEYIAVKEIEHIDFIENGQWEARQIDGVTFDITSPIFHAENEISFR